VHFLERDSKRVGLVYSTELEMCSGRLEHLYVSRTLVVYNRVQRVCIIGKFKFESENWTIKILNSEQRALEMYCNTGKCVNSTQCFFI